MKLLITGDWHLRFKRPRSRTDPVYFLTQVDKINQIFKAAKEEGCDYILQPGDFFDSDQTPWSVFTKYVYLFRKWKIPILCVSGQHDMRYRSKDFNTTPLGGMQATNLVRILDSEPFKDDNTRFYGCSWRQDIPEIEDKDCFNILIIHKMIVDEKLWEGQTGHEYANSILREYNFNLIVSGDNHKSFIAESKGKSKILINCGSLMRTNIDQIDHKPVFYIFDTDGGFEKYFIDVKPPNEVFDLDWVEDVKERNKNLEDFLNALELQKIDYNTDRSEGLVGGLNFIDNLYNAIDQLKLSDGVKDIFEEVLDGK